MNKAIILGRLTKDPEVRFTNNTNTKVVNFTLAVKRRFKKEGEPEAGTKGDEGRDISFLLFFEY